VEPQVAAQLCGSEMHLKPAYVSSSVPSLRRELLDHVLVMSAEQLRVSWVNFSASTMTHGRTKLLPNVKPIRGHRSSRPH
jgi:hypothetical protein